MFARKGGGERFDPGYTQYLQCLAGVSHSLADLCNYGSSNVCRKILQGNLITNYIMIDRLNLAVQLICIANVCVCVFFFFNF